MRTRTRHQLKQDRFSRVTVEAAEATVHWSVEHKSKLMVGVIAAVVIAAAVIGAWYYLNQRDLSAGTEFTKAIRTLDTPLRPEGMSPQPDAPSFTSLKERATEAHKQFQAVADKFPHTRSAEFARYFLGLTASQLGDNAAAERDLKTIASSHNDDLSALARFALASVYRNSGRSKDAIELYKKLIDKPARTVSKVAAQLELGATYQADQQPAEAKRIYEQIRKENPSGEAAQLAAAKLQELK